MTWRALSGGPYGAATPKEHDFLVRHFDLLFPAEAPLDLAAFLSLAKLVLVRRIVKALVRHHGAPVHVQTFKPVFKATGSSARN